MGDLETAPFPISKQEGIDVTSYLVPEEVYEFLKRNVLGTMKIVGTYYQFTSTEIARYMGFIYQKRIDIKRKYPNGLPPEVKLEDDSLKLAMNCIYGKLCEKTRDVKTKYKRAQFTEEPIKDVKLKSPLSGLYVSWMGRLMIYKHIHKVLERGYKFLYSDTDSIKFVHPKGANLGELFHIGKEKLGDWKNEGQFQEFTSHVRKKYALINYINPELSKFAISGINGSLKLPEIFIKYLKNPDTYNQTLRHIRTMFHTSKNVVIRNAKTVSLVTNRFNQTVIRTSDFNTNPRAEKNTVATMEVNPDALEYRWEWIDGKG